MRESRTYGSGRGACDETHVPTATASTLTTSPGRTLGALLRAIVSRSVDHLVGNRTTKRRAGHGVAAIVNAGPDARLVGFLGERGKRGGVTRGQVPDDGARRGRKGAMSGCIAW